MKSSRELFVESQAKHFELSKNLLQLRYAALRQTSNDMEIQLNSEMAALDNSRCDVCLLTPSYSYHEDNLVFCDCCNAAIH